MSAIDIHHIATLDELFRQRIRATPDNLAYRQHYPTAGWVETRWGEMGAMVARWQAALTNEPLHKGDRIGIMLANSTEWVCCEQAAMGLGLVVVPLYTNDRPDNVAFILQEAGIRLLVCGGEEHWQQLEPIRAQLDGLARIVTVAPCGESNQRLTCLDEWLPNGEHPLQSADNQPDDMACIVYTSGTTGRPKGVMLSHRNILSNAIAGAATTSLTEQDSFLSFLPLSHMLERTAGYYIPMLVGASVSYARSVADLAEDLLTIKPTVLVSVPRIYERVHGKITTQLEEKSPLAQRLFAHAVAVGWQRFQYQQGQAPWSPRLLAWPLLKKLVAGKIMAKLGGRLKLAICGGAPLSADVAKTFIGLGLNLLQGYGLTETSPVISVNRTGHNQPSSVGQPLSGVEVKIGEDHELLTRGEGVMLGYWNNPDATREMIDQDGWLHTGDKAAIVDGYIHITGRLKDIIVLSNGEKVSPCDMELAIATDPLFEQVMVLGEGRPYLPVLTTLNPEQWQRLGIDDDLLNSEQTEQLVLERIGRQLKAFPGYAQVRRIHVALEPWTVELGLITPTLKLKRAKLFEHYQVVIEELYAGH